MIDDNVVDALGNEIKIGERYGYSTSKSGLSRTVVGTAKNVKQSSSRVVLVVEKVNTFLYGGKIDDSFNGNAETIAIRAHMVFPVASMAVQS